MSLYRLYDRYYGQIKPLLLINMATIGAYQIPFIRPFLSFLDYELLGTITLGTLLGIIVIINAWLMYKSKFG